MGEKVYTIRYNIEGTDEAVGKVKNIIYGLNAIRLSLKDIEMVFRGPTIQNIMWTAIQLTRTYTHLRRLQRLFSKEQDVIFAKALAIQAATIQTPAGTVQVGGFPGAARGAWGMVTSFAGAHPVATAIGVGTVIGVGLYGAYHWRTVQARKAYRERMREIAVRQGIEP